MEFRIAELRGVQVTASRMLSSDEMIVTLSVPGRSRSIPGCGPGDRRAGPHHRALHRITGAGGDVARSGCHPRPVITKVSPKRGDRMRGLVEYLFGPGKRNEHTHQRIVAAYDDELLGPHPGEFERARVAAELDYPRRWFAPETTSEFVYHVSISNPVEDRDLTDAEWALVAETAAERLGFGQPHSPTGVRWVAVHHGKSTAGNDHIHLVANMVREDGGKHWLRSDYTVLRGVAKEMEARFGLVDRTAPIGAGTPELSRVEVARQLSTGRESDREVVRRSVRSAATAARTESEFIGHARVNGLILRPRWGTGASTDVTGYAAARPSKDTATDSLVFFSGLALGRDLSLPALRAGWEPDPAAAAAWKAATQRGATAPRRTPVHDPRAVTAAGQAMTVAHQRMAATPGGDRAAWSAFARDGAGVFAAMAQQLPDRRVRTPLTQAAHALASAAWRAPHRHIERPPDGGALWRVAQAMLTAGGAQSEVFGTLVLVQQMMRLAQTISDTHETAGRLGQARWAAEAAERAGLAAHRMHTDSAPPTQERGAEPQRAVPEQDVAGGKRANRSRQRPSDAGAVREDREWGR